MYQVQNCNKKKCEMSPTADTTITCKLSRTRQHQYTKCTILKQKDGLQRLIYHLQYQMEQ